MPKRPSQRPSDEPLLSSVYYAGEELLKKVVGDWDGRFANALADALEQALDAREAADVEPPSGESLSRHAFRHDLQNLRYIAAGNYGRNSTIATRHLDAEKTLTTSGALLLALNAEVDAKHVRRVHGWAAEVDSLVQQWAPAEERKVQDDQVHLTRQLARSLVDLRLAGGQHVDELATAIGNAYVAASDRFSRVLRLRMTDIDPAEARASRDFAKQVARTAVMSVQSPTMERIAVMQQATTSERSASLVAELS